MKKLMRILCLAAIACVVYLIFTTPHEEAEPAIVNQVKSFGQEAVKQADAAIGDAVKQADEVIDSAVEQADKALGDAIDSAAEGAKQGFLESLKESASEFWESIFN